MFGWVRDGLLIIENNAIVLCDDCPCGSFVDVDCITCCDLIPQFLEFSIADTIGAGTPFPFEGCSEEECTSFIQRDYLLEWDIAGTGACNWSFSDQHDECIGGYFVAIAENQVKDIFNMNFTFTDNGPAIITYDGPTCNASSECPMLVPNTFTLSNITHSGSGKFCEYDDFPEEITVSPV